MTIKCLSFTPLQLLLLTSFVLLWTSKSLIARYSQKDGEYYFNVTSVVITTELLKLIIVFAYFVWYTPQWFSKLLQSYEQGVYYSIPGFLYLLINHLYYMSFRTVDPGTFWVLYQLRILVSGLLSQLILKKSLGKRKWFALFLLVIGCIIHQFDQVIKLEGWEAVLVILLQCLFSSLSGVYNEHLFKKEAKMDFSLQNIWLYSFNILFNIIFLFIMDFDLIQEKKFFQGYDFLCIINILLTAFGGLATASILKYLSAIMKEYGTSIVMIVTTLGTHYILHEKELHVRIFASILIVSCSLFLYAYEPPPPKIEIEKEPV